MFEQEAKLRSKEWFSNNVDTSTYKTPFTERYCYELGFKDGAETGYNKAKELHYLKDGDLPKENQEVLIYFILPDRSRVAIAISKFKDNDFDVADLEDVVAWKEFVPPESLKI